MCATVQSQTFRAAITAHYASTRCITQHFHQFAPQSSVSQQSSEIGSRMDQLDKLVSRLEKVTVRLESLGAAKPQPAPKPSHLAASADVPAHVKAYDVALSDVLERWSALSKEIGGDVSVMQDKVVQLFGLLRNFLWTAAGRAEPSVEEVQKLIAPVVNLLTQISTFKEAQRKSPLYNHLCAVSEGIPAVGWVLVKKTPAPHVKDMLEASTFYINRIFKDYKESDKKHVEWARTWKELLETMHNFVRQTHTTGLVWNSAPGSSPPAEDRAATGDHASAPSAPAPPPPPPPPPPSFFANSTPGSAPGNDQGTRDALFAEINKGEAITSGLRKVTADMQTHKNPSLRDHKPITVHHSEHPQPAKPAAAVVAHAPVIELKDGKKWEVEYVVGNRNVVVNAENKKQTIYVYKCQDSVIIVKGKVNSITLDSCKKTSIVFDALVAQFECINCQSIQIQTLGEMPTLSIQKTDGCQVYLSEAAKAAEIVTSKSSEMNVLIPTADGDFTEFPVPEQFKTTFDGKKLVTVVSDIV